MVVIYQVFNISWASMAHKYSRVSNDGLSCDTSQDAYKLVQALTGYKKSMKPMKYINLLSIYYYWVIIASPS